MVTNMISQLKESFPLTGATASFQISFTKLVFKTLLLFFSSSLKFRFFETEIIITIVFISPL